MKKLTIHSRRGGSDHTARSTILVPWPLLLLLALGLLLPVDCLASWSDISPGPINQFESPGPVNAHANSGGRRIVRIGNTIIALAPHNSQDRTYRSTNNGASWTRIDSEGTHSGCLITGPDEMVYHFYRYIDDICMVRFRYDAEPPSPVTIYSNASVSNTNTGVYHSVNAIVDEEGTLYVSTHWRSGSYDVLYVFNSTDGGDSWNGPYQVSSGSSDWYYPHLEVSGDNQLAITYGCRTGNRSLQFAVSNNRGQTWIRTQMATGLIQNPALLAVGDDSYYVFCQANEGSLVGIYYKQSTNNGQSWDANWQLVEDTCGYGDPSPALGSDGSTIYLACRSSNGTGIESGTCGDRSRPKLIRSLNLGQSWTTVDDNYGAERGGSRHQLRYQTWWNYGGPVEWIWMQYVNNGANHPIYYDLNLDVEIHSQEAGPPDTTPPDPPEGVVAEALTE